MARAFFLGSGLAYLALGSWLGGPGALMSWLGLSLFLIGVAYVMGSARLMGKRSDGSFPVLALVVHAPFLISAWLALELRRRRGEAPWNEVAPGIFVGRMSPLRELPPGVRWVIDLTCELVPPRGVRGPTYRCLPTLDGTAPPDETFWPLVKEVAQLDAPVFIHCAAGHGRSATFAAAVMVQRGLAADVDAAEAMMKRQRPRVALGAAQRALVQSGDGRAAP
jgi:protein-tyrosine phosphatase